MELSTLSLIFVFIYLRQTVGDEVIIKKEEDAIHNHIFNQNQFQLL